MFMQLICIRYKYRCSCELSEWSTNFSIAKFKEYFITNHVLIVYPCSFCKALNSLQSDAVGKLLFVSSCTFNDLPTGQLIYSYMYILLEIYYWFLYILIAASILIKISALSQILILSAHCTSNKFSLNIVKIYFYFSRCDNYKLPWRMSVVYCLYELGIISCSTITMWENTCLIVKKVYLMLINKPIFLYS